MRSPLVLAPACLALVLGWNRRIEFKLLTQ